MYAPERANKTPIAAFDRGLVHPASAGAHDHSDQEKAGRNPEPHAELLAEHRLVLELGPARSSRPRARRRPRARSVAVCAQIDFVRPVALKVAFFARWGGAGRELDLAAAPLLRLLLRLADVRRGELVAREHLAAQGGRDEQRAEEVDKILADGDEPAAETGLDVRLDTLVRAEDWVAGHIGAERKQYDTVDGRSMSLGSKNVRGKADGERRTVRC